MQHDEDDEQPTGPSYITTLPNEVISQIFLRGTEAWRELEPLQIPFPLLVSSISTHWRNIAHSTSELWTFILPPLFKGQEACLRWASDWLARAGVMPVAVVLDHKVTEREPYSEALATSRAIAALLELFARHAHRLRRLDVRSDWPGTFWGFFEDGLDAPLLEQLSLCSRYDPIPAPFTSLSTLPSTDQPPYAESWRTPSLKKLRLKNIRPPQISNLTSLTVYHLLVGVEDVKTLFTLSPHLAHLVLHHLLPVNGVVPEQFELITAPSLRSIAISSQGAPPRNEEPPKTFIFNLLRIPNLTYLEIDGNVVASSLFKNALPNPASVKKLRICNRNNKFPHDPEFYQSLSGLEELELIRTPIQALLDPEQRPRRRSIELREPLYRTRGPMFNDAALVAVGQQHELPFVYPSPTSLPAGSESLWPGLRSITVDVLSAEQLVPLVRFTVLRNSNTKGAGDARRLESFRLSLTAMRHLSRSMKRNGDEVFLVPSPGLSRRFGGGGDAGTKDVREWLSGMVDVELLQRESLGLLDADRVPLEEMV